MPIYNMAKLPTYFDSQASAAATLGIDISELRRAKAEGCPAFRSGRVYTAPLLAWFAEKRRQRAEQAAAKTVDGISDPSLLNDSEKGTELPKSHWDRKKARLDYERALFRFDLEKEKYLEANEAMGAVGQMLVGFRTALNMLPATAARWLVGLRDFHRIKEILESEVDAVINSLRRCDYMKTEPGEVMPVTTLCSALRIRAGTLDKRRSGDGSECLFYVVIFGQQLRVMLLHDAHVITHPDGNLVNADSFGNKQ
jgi:hypothetical protein